MDQQLLVESHPAGNNAYAFDGQMLIITAIATVFMFVVLLVSLHFYARWWLRQAAAARRTHVVVLADNHNPSSAADRGLEPAVLNSLPVFTFSSKEPAPAPERALLECAVCLSEFEEEETVRLLPRCNHAFHIGCIDMWFHSHSTCPLCRSPVEPAAEVVSGPEPSPEVVVEVSGSEPGSSSGCDLCATCRHAERSENVSDDGNTAPLSGRRKAMDVRIDVGPPRRRADAENELSQSSPLSRLLSFKSLLSMRMKSPVGGRNGAEMNRAGAATELDLEDGLGEPIRVHTPK